MEWPLKLVEKAGLDRVVARRVTKAAVAVGTSLLILHAFNVIVVPPVLLAYSAFMTGLAVFYFAGKFGAPRMPQAGQTCYQCNRPVHFAGFECENCGVIKFEKTPIAAITEKP